MKNELRDENPKLNRLRLREKWNEKYLNYLDNFRSYRNDQRNANSTQLYTHSLSALIAVKLIRKVKSKHNGDLDIGIKTVENVKLPKILDRWRYEWNKQLLCLCCNEPALHEAVSCSSCNNIAHYNCIRNDLVKNSKSLNIKSMFVLNAEVYDSSVNQIEYICKLCFEDYSYSCAVYSSTLSKLKKDRAILHYSELIASWVAIKWKAKKLNRKKKAELLLRRAVNRNLLYRRFQNWRRNELRIVILDILNIFSSLHLTERHLVTVTIVDPITHVQVYRSDKIGVRCYYESFLLHGVSANMGIIVTISLLRKEDSRVASTIYEALFQLFFPLKDVKDFTKKKDYEIKLDSRIFWAVHPISKGDVQIVVSNDTYVYHNGTELTKVRSNRVVLPSLRNQSTEENRFTSFERISSYENISYDKNKIKFRYFPMNSMVSCCCLANAPALDFLRNGFDMKGRPNHRMALWWICLFGLKIYFFKRYSDCIPSVIIDIKDFSVSNIRDNKGNIQLVNLQSNDGLKWNLQFFKNEDAVKFESVINESHKVVSNNSDYFKLESIKTILEINKKFGFENIK